MLAAVVFANGNVTGNFAPFFNKISDDISADANLDESENQSQNQSENQSGAPFNIASDENVDDSEAETDDASKAGLGEESATETEYDSEDDADKNPEAGSEESSGNESQDDSGDESEEISGSVSEYNDENHSGAYSFDISEIPAYSGSPYYVLNNNVPEFTDSEKVTDVFENYSDLDYLGRCGSAYANICPELMPTEERGEIGDVRPSGWHTVKYPDIIEDRYLYNRCHLIAYELAGQNANEKNLITGTRYLNIEGMLEFENMVAGYVRKTSNHVLYRVTPIFEDDNLVASGVHMEGYSVEDSGEGIQFNIYAYNVQPGIIIDYATGESCAETDYEGQSESGSIGQQNDTSEAGNSDNGISESGSIANDNGESDSIEVTYVLNKNTKKFHLPSCKSVSEMKESNKVLFYGTRDEAIEEGYSPCGRCNP